MPPRRKSSFCRESRAQHHCGNDSLPDKAISCSCHGVSSRDSPVVVSAPLRGRRGQSVPDWHPCAAPRPWSRHRHERLNRAVKKLKPACASTLEHTRQALRPVRTTESLFGDLLQRQGLDEVAKFASPPSPILARPSAQARSLTAHTRSLPRQHCTGAPIPWSLLDPGRLQPEKPLSCVGPRFGSIQDHRGPADRLSDAPRWPVGLKHPTYGPAVDGGSNRVTPTQAFVP